MGLCEDLYNAQTIDRITVEANYYEAKACEIFTQAYRKNAEKAMKLLVRRSGRLGDKTVLELAEASNSLEFMALDGVQEKLAKIWVGEKSDEHILTMTFIERFSLITFFSPKPGFQALE